MSNGKKYKMETQIKERTRNQDQKYAFYFFKNKIKSDNAMQKNFYGSKI